MSRFAVTILLTDVEISLQKYKKNVCLWFFQDKEFEVLCGNITKKQECASHIPAFNKELLTALINRIRLILFFFWHGGQPVLFFRSWSPFSKGNRVCSFFFCLRVEMFFSYYLMFYLLLEILGCKIRNYFSNIQFIGFKIPFSICFFLSVKFFEKKLRKILPVSKKVLSLHSQFEERLIFLSG